MQVDMEWPFHCLGVIVSHISLKDLELGREEKVSEERGKKENVGTRGRVGECV